MDAVGYIRRSSGGESAISRSAQEKAIAAAAEVRDDHVGRTFIDWGRSGSDRTRPAFLEMVAAIEAGQVSAVYAYDADRLARRTATLAMLLDAASETGTAVVDRMGRDLAGKDRLVGEVMGVVDSEVLRKMTERNRENRRTRKARGDEDGPAPYGYRRECHDADGNVVVRAWGKLQPGERYVFVVDDADAIARVVELYRETRSLNETARALNRAGVKADRGGGWHAASVTRVIDRNAPGLRRAAMGRGVRAGAKPRILLRLLRCHCGQVMSPSEASVRGRDYTRWYCRQAVVGEHGGPHGITQSKLLPIIQAEADRLVVPHDGLIVPGERYDDSTERAEVADLRARGRDAIADALEADLDAERRAHGAYREIATAIPPRIDWDAWTIEAINTALRALFIRIDLGPDLLPSGFAWAVPEWRA